MVSRRLKQHDSWMILLNADGVHGSDCPFYCSEVPPFCAICHVAADNRLRAAEDLQTADERRSSEIEQITTAGHATPSKSRQDQTWDHVHLACRAGNIYLWCPFILPL